MKASTPPYPDHVLQWTKVGTLTTKVLGFPRNNPMKAMVIVSLFFILFLILLVNVWIHIDIIHVGYQMAHLKHREKTLRIEQRNLMIQRAALFSNSHLQALAKRKFHLTPLTPEQIVTIDEKN